MAAASLVLGIISLVIGAFFAGFQWIGVIVGIIGIVLGVKSNDPEKAGLAKAGKICSIIGLILSAIVYVACIACVGGIATLASL